MENKKELLSIGSAVVEEVVSNEELLTIAKEQHDQIVMLWKVVNKLRNKRGDEYKMGYGACMEYFDRLCPEDRKELSEDLDEIFGYDRKC